MCSYFFLFFFLLSNFIGLKYGRFASEIAIVSAITYFGLKQRKMFQETSRTPSSKIDFRREPLRLI